MEQKQIRVLAEEEEKNSDPWELLRWQQRLQDKPSNIDKNSNIEHSESESCVLKIFYDILKLFYVLDCTGQTAISHPEPGSLGRVA